MTPTNTIVELVAQNPFSDRLELYATSYSVQGKALRLVDMLGRIVWSGIWPSGVQRWSIETPALTQGTFLLTAVGPEQGFKPISVVHVSP